MSTRGKVARPDGVEESLLLDNQLCFKLYAASRAVIRGYRPLLEQIGLTYPQYLVMLVLWEWHASPPEQPTVKALGDRLLLDSGTLTPLLSCLEQLGLVDRRRASHDEREVHLTLTVPGITLRERVIPAAPAADLQHRFRPQRDVRPAPAPGRIAVALPSGGRRLAVVARPASRSR